MRTRDYISLSLFALLVIGLIAIKAISLTTTLWAIYILSSLFLLGVHFLTSYLALSRNVLLGIVVFLVPIAPTIFLVCNFKKYKELLAIQLSLIALFLLTKFVVPPGL